MTLIKTCEFVSPQHPDKTCDFIADSILDAYLTQDPKSRVAVEVLGGHRLITITGEVTSNADVDAAKIARAAAGENYEVNVRITRQSPEIAQGIDRGGAGDQGIMVGYACAETENLMPYDYELARQLCRKIYEQYPVDGKVQLTLEGRTVKSAVASFQGTKSAALEGQARSFIKAANYFINPAGEWRLGGFEADSGLSGRKLVIDSYGPNVPVGGGSFSGKDPTKPDRFGAYMARYAATQYLKKFKAQEVLVKLAYAIGVAEPVMAVALIDGRERPINDFDLTPLGIIKLLNLRRPIYAQTAHWGHFGRGFAWDG